MNASVSLLAGLAIVIATTSVALANPPTEAPAGFDDLTIDASFVSADLHKADRLVFEEKEDISPNGLGPLYNAQSCRECHQNPTTGAVSQITELRVGHRIHERFEAADIVINDGKETISGRTLINDRAICPEIQERVPEHSNPGEKNVQTFRLSLNTLGDGFVEAVLDQTLLDIQAAQCSSQKKHTGTVCGQAILVPVLEAPNKTAIGRFGWKDQHASLRSFASDAYLNEMGITNTLLPNEVTKTCMPATIQEPNDTPAAADHLEDSDHFARFMRASKVPPRDLVLAATPAAKHGEVLFAQLKCDVCHVATLQTAPKGSKVLAGAYAVPDALADKIIHPYSDFLLHDVNTGDGIAIAVTEHYGVRHTAVAEKYQQVKAEYADADYATDPKANRKFRDEVFRKVDELIAREGFSYQAVQDAQFKLRTPPLWGLRTHSRLMHDAASVRLEDAIERHGHEAAPSADLFRHLSATDKQDLLKFLGSL